MRFCLLIVLLLFAYSPLSSQTNAPMQELESEETLWLEDFEKDSVVSNGIICTMVKWKFDNALIGSTGFDEKNGSQSARINVGGSIYMLNAKANGLGTLSFKYARFGSDGPATIKVQMRTSITGLTTNFDISDTIICDNTVLEEYSQTVNQPGNIYVKIIQLSGTRINVDDVQLTDYILPTVTSWTGKFDNIWNKAVNWYGGTPGYKSNVIIPGSTPFVELKDTATYNNLTLRPGGQMKLIYGKNLHLTGDLTLECDSTGMASLVSQGNLTVAGQTHLKLELAGLKGASKRPWWYLAVPLDNVTSGAFNLADGTNKLSYYKEDSLPSPVYVQIKDNSTLLHPATGYVLYQGSRDSVFTFTGSLNTADQTIYPTRTGSTAAKRGFNLIGNPYTAYLDWNKVVRYNVRPTIWLRTRSAGGQMVFDTYDGIVGTANGAAGVVTNLIPPCQAFWTKVDSDNSTGELSFTRFMLYNDSPSNPLRMKSSESALETELPVLRLRLCKGTTHDETILLVNTGASTGFDDYDSPKLSNNNPLVPEIFSLADREELVINHTGTLFQNQQIALGMRPGEEGVYILKVHEMQHFSKSTKIYLLDRLLGKETRLYNGTSYAFQCDGAALPDRFSLRFYSPDFPLDNPEIDVDELKIYVNKQRNLQIENLNQNSMDIVVYNAAGQVLQTVTEVKHYIGRLPHAGVFFVRVQVAGIVTVRKVIAP